MDDDEKTTGDPINSGSSTGGHLRTYDSGSGFVSDDITLTANMNFLAPGGAQWGMGVTFGAVQDDRGVRITSENDTTFKRGTDSTGAPVAIPNIPNASGVIYADMKAPSPPILFSTIYPRQWVSFIAGTYGQWHSDSAYVWHESQTGTEADGIFSAAYPPFNLDVGYTLDGSPPKSQSHVFISCTELSGRRTGHRQLLHQLALCL